MKALYIHNVQVLMKYMKIKRVKAQENHYEESGPTVTDGEQEKGNKKILKLAR